MAVNSKYVVASGLDDDHYIYLFNKESGALMATEKGGKDVIIGLKWANEQSFVSVGLKHYKYWDVSEKSIKAKVGSFGSNCNLLCSAEGAG